jgi:hypothetical protein
LNQRRSQRRDEQLGLGQIVEHRQL